MARKLWAAIERFNQRFEVILVDLDDRHLAFRVLRRVRSVRGIDHDRLAEFLPDRTREAPCSDRSGRGHRGFCARRPRPGKQSRCTSRSRARFAPRSLVALGRPPDMNATISSHASRPLPAPSLSSKTSQHRSVKFFGLPDAHPVNLEADDRQTGLRKDIDHAAGPQVRKFEIVGLNQNQRLLDLRFRQDSSGPYRESRRRCRNTRPRAGDPLSLPPHRSPSEPPVRSRSPRPRRS